MTKILNLIIMNNIEYTEEENHYYRFMTIFIGMYLFLFLSPQWSSYHSMGIIPTSDYKDIILSMIYLLMDRIYFDKKYDSTDTIE